MMSGMFSWFRDTSSATAPSIKASPSALVVDEVRHPAISPSGYWEDPQQAPRLMVITGAGLSAESGLDTFRETGGLWQRFNVDEVCSMRGWEAHKDASHAFHDALRQAVINVSPNLAHHLLANLNGPQVVVVTQNVDGLLERGGARSIVNVHGRLDRLKCVACDQQWQVPWTYQWQASPVKACPFCQVEGQVKPGVVFFHESAPLYRPMQNILFGLREQDAVAVVGTAGTVLALSQWLKYVPAYKWLLNMEATDALPEGMFDKVTYGPVTQTLPELVDWWHHRCRSSSS